MQSENEVFEYIYTLGVIPNKQGEDEMSLKAVIFDLGNTLITYPNPDEVSKHFHEKAVEIATDDMLPKVDYPTLLRKLSEKYLDSRENSFESLKEATFAESLESALQELQMDMSGDEQEYLIEDLYEEFFRKEARLINGVPRITRFLYSADLKIAVISNTPWPGYLHAWDMEAFGVQLDSLLFPLPTYWSSQEGLRKPHPELFRKVLNELKVTPDEAIYVGDNFSRDVVGPNSIGMKAIWISAKSIPEGYTLNGWQVANLVEAKALIETLIKE